MLQSITKNLQVFSGLPFSSVTQIYDESGNLAILGDYIAYGAIIVSGNSRRFESQNLRIYGNRGILELYLTAEDTFDLPLGSHTYVVYLQKGGNSFLVLSGTFIVREKALLLVDNTAWDDLRVAATAAKAAGVKDPGFAKFTDNGSGSTGVYLPWFDKTNEEELFFTLQTPHGYSEGTTLRPHVHWVVKGAPGAGQFPVWGLEYTWANIGGVFPNTTIIKSDATTAVAATIQGDSTLVAFTHYLTLLPTIEGTGKTLSSQLIARIFRDAGNSDDDLDEDAGLIEIDFHAQFDGFGSSDVFTK